MAILAEDEEVARSVLAASGEPARASSRKPSLREWDPIRAGIADLFDATMQVRQAIVASAGVNPGSVPAYPRPETAMERVIAAERKRYREETVRRLDAMFFPPTE